MKPMTAEWVSKAEGDFAMTEREARARKKPSKLSGDETTLEDRSLAQITAILTEVFLDKPCAVYLFGSRARGTNNPASDFDIAIEAADDISNELSLAREHLEESNIPYIVELVELQATSQEFAHKIQQEGFVLWRN
jgi:predicted nucleotidyltransferase